MGFTVIVEAGYGDGLVFSRLPTHQGGKAVFAFLMGLQSYCLSDNDMEPVEWRNWFNNFQTSVNQPLCETFQPIMDCMWGDGGGIGGEFFEDEYEWYHKRASNWPDQMTEAEFKEFVQASKVRWSPVDKVLANVKLLVEVFKTAHLTDADALYVAKDTLPDFESLYETLKIFQTFRYDTVRLNFS